MTYEYSDTLVLFDVGGVLVSLDFQSYYEKAVSYSYGITIDELKRRLIDSRIDYLACKGLISEDDYISGLRNVLNCSEWISTETLESAVSTAWKGQIDKMIILKEEIHRTGHNVGILSNMHALAHKQIMYKYPQVFQTFDRKSPKIFSFQVGAMKPEVSIYQNVTGYKNIIYIDDRELYLKVPVERFGWKGIWFTQYIDETELIRSIHPNGNNFQYSEDFKVAHSFEDVKEYLVKFGIKI